MRLRLAVPDLDAFLRSGLVKPRTLVKLFAGRRNRGIRLARAALLLSDRRAESHPESELRVVLHFGGYRPIPQYIVRHNGRFVARLDLALDRVKFAIEYDGKWHRDPDQRRIDQARRTKLANAGWHVIVIDAERLASDHGSLLAYIASSVNAATAATAATAA